VGGEPREKRRTVGRLLGEIALVLVLVYGIGRYQTRNHPRGLPPNVALTADSDTPRPANLADFRGKPTLVVVWAPWCGVCKAEADNVARAKRWLGDRANVVTVAAAYENVDEVRAFAKAHDLPTPVLLAPPDFPKAFAISAYPTVFVLDAAGNLVGSAQGYTSTIGLVVRALTAG
jgi:thiol-disulfide isomerase/thioredoxin